jgi:hypothetical protein
VRQCGSRASVVDRVAWISAETRSGQLFNHSLGGASTRRGPESHKADTALAGSGAGAVIGVNRGMLFTTECWEEGK